VKKGRWRERKAHTHTGRHTAPHYHICGDACGEAWTKRHSNGPTIFFFSLPFPDIVSHATLFSDCFIIFCFSIVYSLLSFFLFVCFAALSPPCVHPPHVRPVTRLRSCYWSAAKPLPLPLLFPHHTPMRQFKRVRAWQLPLTSFYQLSFIVR
jgi:hypothetical protein